MNTKSEVVSKLTPLQIDLLQTQIRQLKALGKRFSESNIPRFIETIHNNHRNRSLNGGNQPNSDPNVKQPQVIDLISHDHPPNVQQSNPSNSSNITADSKGSDQMQPVPSTYALTTKTGAVTMAPAPHTTSAPAPSLSMTQPALSWLCFNSLLFSGPSNQTSSDFSHSISFSTSDFGCFMKSAHVPLLPTGPFVAELTEKTLLLSSKQQKEQDNNTVVRGTDASNNCVISNAIGVKSDDATNHHSGPPLWMIQRQMRSALVRHHISDILSTGVPSNASMHAASKDKLHPLHPPTFLGAANYVSDLIPYRNFYHTKKQDRNFVRNYEKQERRKRQDNDERRRRKVVEFHKMLLVHKEEFFRFHKGKRSESVKHARLAMMHVERTGSMREKDDARAEMRRIQALQENDMEAYANLIKDTKNGRLKFLLNETDTYISEINRMIQEQRVVLPDEADVVNENQKDNELKPGVKESSNSSSNGESNLDAAASSISTVLSPSKTSQEDHVTDPSEGPKRISATTKDYYRSTHRTIEQVKQPSMLRGGDLKEYQLSGLQWLVSLYNNKLNGILADEMGLGKTIQTIALICYLMEVKGNKGPFLIVVPLSTLSNWVNEFNKWAPDAIKVVYKGTPDERKRLFREEVEPGRLNALLTTYEYIMKDKASLRKPCWQYIIVDEGHRMKNAESKFAQILGQAYQSKNRILLTGTPLQNDLAELWALLNFLLPKIFHSSDTFDQWFNKPFAQFRNQTAAANPSDDNMSDNPILTQEERLLIVNRLHEVLRPFVLRRVKSEVLTQLPEKVEKILRCNLSGWQRKMYQSIVHKGLVRNKDGVISGGLSNAIMHLRKVCNHPYLFVRDYMVDEDLIRISGKFELLDRMLPKLFAGNHRVLMFSQMVGALNFLEQFLHYRGFACCRLDGNTSAEDREKRVAEFNAPDSPYFIFLLSTRAGGLGINLATADTVIIFDSDWNPSMDAQAQDRAHRIGQKKEVRVFRLVTTSPIEERVLARATDKKNLNGLVVEAGGFNARTSSNDQDHKEMMEALLNDWANGAAFEVGGSDGAVDDEGNALDDQQAEDDQINEMMASSEEELKLYQSMDKEYDSRRLRNWQLYHNSVNKRTPPLPPRLMDAHELPPWMTEDCWQPKYSVLMRDMMCTTTVASGSRLGMVAAPPKKKGRRKANGLVSDEGDDDSLDDQLDMDEAGSDVYMVAGKVMRKRKEVQYDDGMTDRQYSKYVERMSTEQVMAPPSSSQSTLTNKDKATGPIYQELLTVLQQLQQIRKDDGSFLASLFVDKPPRQYYPDYYVLIPQPISLKNISSKLKKTEYSYFEQIALDFALMSHNARVYNLDTSSIFRDCEALRAEFHRRSAPLLLKNGLIDKNDLEAIDASKQSLPLPPSSHEIFHPSYIFRMKLSTAPHTEATRDDSSSNKKAKYSRNKEPRLSLVLAEPSKNGSSSTYANNGMVGDGRRYDEDSRDDSQTLSFRLSLKKRKTIE